MQTFTVPMQNRKTKDSETAEENKLVWGCSLKGKLKIKDKNAEILNRLTRENGKLIHNSIVKVIKLLFMFY